ncbi:MAG: DNA gyrase subunit A [Bacteroidetes bacterium]|nr:DNA gyrase subunit A [Bacteroidota bacterium]
MAINEKIVPVDIEEEMKSSYIDYAMSVIVSRALPDVRDGLKPVHRRVLYGMQDLGLAAGKTYKKSARIVGEVLGKYHPHGETSVYDSIVRMAQDFSLRYTLVDGQGNFGSVDGDSPAAMRYTEVRLSKIAEEMLRDLNKNTVAFTPNFDDTLSEPTVLPAQIPNLLINGSSGIAVGMSSNIPPHNLGEVIDGLLLMIDEPEIENKKLMKHIIAPDFPTGGIIYGYDGVREAYEKGRGKITIRAKAVIETSKGDRERIIISELPYQVNKAFLIERIADLVRDKKVEDISDIRDESDRDGMRIVIELKRDGNAAVVLNNLYVHTSMQTTFGIIMLALVDGRPRVLQLKEILKFYLEHRNEIIVKRTKFDLEEAEARAHILEGYIIALDNIDAIIKLIKASKDVETAKLGLMKKFKLSEIQAKSILEMRLQKLTGLERSKVEEEYREIIKLISKLKSILASKRMQLEIIKEELREIKRKYSDKRKTEIIYKSEEFKLEDVIADENVVITISHQGYIKRTPTSDYRTQGRGGKGVMGASSREDDFVTGMFIASTHEYILVFTDLGRCYWLKVFEVPEGSRISKGKAIVNLISKEPQEKITTFLPVKSFEENLYVTMVTENGIIKKSSLSDYSNPRKNGIVAIKLKKADKLCDVKLTNGSQDIFIGSHDGLAIRFKEKEARVMGRSASGVRAIRLRKGDKVVGAVATNNKNSTILVASEKGYGKRSKLDEYRVSHRGGKGVFTQKATDKTGKLIAIKEVSDKDDVVVVTSHGKIIRQPAPSIRVSGRNTAGVRLIRLDEKDKIAAVAVVTTDEEKQIEESKSPKTDKKTETKNDIKKKSKKGK